MRDNQVFQNWIFLVHGRDELLWARTWQNEANTTDAIILLECKDCSLFIFCGDLVMMGAADDKWKGR